MRLEQRNNRFYLVDVMLLDSEPIRRKLYFRVEFMEGLANVGEEFRKTNHGVYRTLRANVTINPSAPCEFMEDEVVPPPKLRSGTKARWHQGGWQKWTNANGWVIA